MRRIMLAIAIAASLASPLALAQSHRAGTTQQPSAAREARPAQGNDFAPAPVPKSAFGRVMAVMIAVLQQNSGHENSSHAQAVSSSGDADVDATTAVTTTPSLSASVIHDDADAETEANTPLPVPLALE